MGKPEAKASTCTNCAATATGSGASTFTRMERGNHPLLHGEAAGVEQGPWQCRMDGCRYGLRNDQGEFLNKAWTILTTDLHFYNEFRLKVCLKNHQHAWVHGMDTARSAYYPRAMCTSIARNWQKVLIPQRWLTMLWTASIEQEN